MFQIPQNITLYIIVGNTIGSNKFIITAIIKDIEVIVKSGGTSGLPFHLEHQYNGNIIRHIEGEGTLSLPLLPVPYHNNGIYQCIIYKEIRKSAILQKTYKVYKFKGLPVFAEGNSNLLQDVSGRNISVQVLVYSIPNITEVKVKGENRSTNSFKIYDITTKPASLHGWNSPSVYIPGAEVNIDIMFQIPQNFTLYVIVGNILGNSKFKMTAIIQEPPTPQVSGQYSFISVATCILGILLFCIITMTTVNCIILKRQRSTTVEIEKSPYIYDKIGTIDYRVTNVPPPIRNMMSPGLTRRMELRRAVENISGNRISIETQESQQDHVMSDVNGTDTVDTRTYLSLPCSVRSSDTNNQDEEEVMILSPEMINENETDSDTEPQNSEISSNMAELLPEDQHRNEITVDTDQLVADINVNIRFGNEVSEDSDSSFSEIPGVPIQSRGQGGNYETVQSNTPQEHMYSECEISNGDNGNNNGREDSNEYINLKIW